MDHEKVRQLRLSALLKGKSPDVSAFVDGLLVEAVELGAGDVHLQPHEGSGRVTVRIRGERREIVRYPRESHEEVARRVKVLTGMLPYVSDRAQDGRMSVELPSGPVQIRASVVPSNHGETIAFRLAGQSSALEIDALGLEPDGLAGLKKLLAEPQGLLLLTGPTGSGKTTTLYSALEHIHKTAGSTTHLASIEDPVEVELSFVHQIQVDRNRKLGFAQALRSLLRQDPDVLMIGEIRDSETAKVAVQAGLSGHLILTTMHADSAVGVFPRLIDLGVEPFLAGSAVVGCVSQRLERRLCEACRHPRSLERKQREKLRALGVDDGKTFFTAEGCSRCSGSGFDGRTALFEVLTMDQELRRLVAAKAEVSRLEEESSRRGSKSLWASALTAAERGEIPLDRALVWAGGEAR